MTIEQEFFETFGIEKKEPCKYGVGCGHSKPCCPRELTCPPITPEIVLGLITILVKKHCNLTLYWGLPKLTEQILKQCIKDSKDKQIQDQVKALFNA
jgi:hypothetical protein